jgi:rhamnose utilization protein RhaD (predicted bifunctional aldolase and dehydrogenase)
MSARFGADPLLVQAGGGNTSIKLDGVLWVKASGRWLMHARDEPMFVPVGLDGVRRRIALREADPVGPELLADGAPPGLRPSIETTLHALLPHTIVLHGHPVAALAWLVRSDADAEIARRMAGLRVAHVPYLRPGVPLTLAIADLIAERPIDVLLLGNHGVVVGAETTSGAEALMQEVLRRLACSPRRFDVVPSIPLLQRALGRTPYRLVPHTACHAIALDPAQAAWAAGGAPYPDHVVFLGGGLPRITAERDDGWLGRLAAADAPAVIVDGAGVLVHEALDPSGHAMLRCLADVAARIPPGTPVRYLPDEEVAMLQQWDAEAYRRAQAPS